jgi:hypothetical protein
MPVKTSKEPWTRQNGNNPAPFSKGLAKDSGDYVVSGNRVLGELHSAYKVRLSADVLNKVCAKEWHALVAHALYKGMIDASLLTIVYKHLKALDADGNAVSSTEETLPLEALQEINRVLENRAKSEGGSNNKPLTRAMRAEIRGELKAEKRHGASRDAAVENISGDYPENKLAEIGKLADDVFGVAADNAPEKTE